VIGGHLGTAHDNVALTECPKRSLNALTNPPPRWGERDPEPSACRDNGKTKMGRKTRQKMGRENRCATPHSGWGRRASGGKKETRPLMTRAHHRVKEKRGSSSTGGPVPRMRPTVKTMKTTDEKEKGGSGTRENSHRGEM